MTTNQARITARKYMGNDAGSWAVFVNGRPAFTGLTRSEVPHYKRLAQEIQNEKGRDEDTGR